MHILATADIHSPKYLHKFCDILQRHITTIRNVDLVLIAGDLMHKGNLAGLQELDKTLDKLLSNNVKVLACPGNEDFEEVLARARILRKVRILEDTLEEIEIRDVRVGIYFTRGVLDKPTLWQKRHMKNIEAVYSNRLEKIRSILGKLSQKYDIPIIVSHYAITYRLLEGEDPRIWPHLGTCRLDELIQKCRVLIVHGHAHNAVRRYANFGEAHIVNVSFPGRDSIYLVEVDSGLMNLKVIELRLDGSRVVLEPKLTVETRQAKKSILDFL